MRFGVVSLFPEVFASPALSGVVGRGLRSGTLRLRCRDPRDYASDRHRTVDDRPFGGGPGMLLQQGPMTAAIAAAREDVPGAPVVFLSPQGERFTQAHAERWSRGPGLVLVCGRYEGLDERVVATVDHELSIGDYVLSGGEIAALAVIDAVARLVPGVLGHQASAVEDSFSDSLLKGPEYTRPAHAAVPPVLLSGDHEAVARWHRQQALRRTWQRRPDLIVRRGLNTEELAALADGIATELDE